MISVRSVGVVLAYRLGSLLRKREQNQCHGVLARPVDDERPGTNSAFKIGMPLNI
jgi:hypothetical protein